MRCWLSDGRESKDSLLYCRVRYTRASHTLKQVCATHRQQNCAAEDLRCHKCVPAHYKEHRVAKLTPFSGEQPEPSLLSEDSLGCIQKS